jgi:hypothetical protein
MSATRQAGLSATWVCLAIAAGLAGCSRQPPAAPARPPNPYAMQPQVISPIDVTRVDLGTAVDPDGSIRRPTSSFRPHETIHAAVITERPGHDIKLTARWLFQDGSADGSVVKEDTQSISPIGTMITDFQATDDAGWPTGQYKLEILVNGNRVAVTAYGVIR